MFDSLKKKFEGSKSRFVWLLENSLNDDEKSRLISLWENSSLEDRDKFVKDKDLLFKKLKPSKRSMKKMGKLVMSGRFKSAVEEV